jgi:hypothetical protein
MKTETTTRNTATALRPIIALTGAALCLSLTSCVAPYRERYNRSSATITTYQPGYRLSRLPSGYRSENLGGSIYYYHNGGGYVVTEAPRKNRYYTEYTRYR